MGPDSSTQGTHEIRSLTAGATSYYVVLSIDGAGNGTFKGSVTATEFITTQSPTASATASDHSIPIVVNGVTMYMRLSSTS